MLPWLFLASFFSPLADSHSAPVGDLRPEHLAATVSQHLLSRAAVGEHLQLCCDARGDPCPALAGVRAITPGRGADALLERPPFPDDDDDDDDDALAESAPPGY